MTETCASCRFFKTGTSDAFPDVNGMCRRWAPQGPVLGCDKNGWQIFPPMNSHYWCGEFRPASEADTISNLLSIIKMKAA
jgi:hypothetical protein